MDVGAGALPDKTSQPGKPAIVGAQQRANCHPEISEMRGMAMRVLILGSGPNAVECRNWDLSAFDAVVAINNAWRVRPDWTHLIHPEDFPVDRRPDHLRPGQQVVGAADYVPLQNRLGGFVHAGGTMAFTAGYWALEALRPQLMAFLGCDMVYPDSGATNFYGTGAADPLRADVTLQSLEAKSARLMLMAAERGCRCVNLSRAEHSRLVFPRVTPAAVPYVPAAQSPATQEDYREARMREDELGYFVPSGRYWEVEDRFDRHALAALDQLWLDALAAHCDAGRRAA